MSHIKIHKFCPVQNCIACNACCDREPRKSTLLSCVCVCVCVEVGEIRLSVFEGVQFDHLSRGKQNTGLSVFSSTMKKA